MLKCLGVVFNIPSAFLGMTFLAFGNSLPELAVNCSLAKNGYGEMAISGSVGGPLFNLVFGFGLTLIKTNLEKGTIVFDIFDKESQLTFVAALILMFNVIRLFIMTCFLKFRLTPIVSYAGFVIYFGFIVFIILFTFI